MFWKSRPATLALLLLPALASAQTTPAPTSATVPARGFVAIHFGGQTGSSDLDDGFTFPQYDETASVNLAQSHGGGFLFNIEGGARVYGRIYAGLAFTPVSSDIDAIVRRQHSSPARLRSAAQRRAALQSDWTMAKRASTCSRATSSRSTTNFEIGVSVGPSFISVSHDVVTGITFQEGASAVHDGDADRDLAA